MQFYIVPWSAAWIAFGYENMDRYKVFRLGPLRWLWGIKNES